MSHTCPAGNEMNKNEKTDVRKTRGQPVSWELSRCVCVCVFDYVCVRLLPQPPHMCVHMGSLCTVWESQSTVISSPDMAYSLLPLEHIVRVHTHTPTHTHNMFEKDLKVENSICINSKK